MNNKTAACTGLVSFGLIKLVDHKRNMEQLWLLIYCYVLGTVCIQQTVVSYFINIRVVRSLPFVSWEDGVCCDEL